MLVLRPFEAVCCCEAGQYKYNLIWFQFNSCVDIEWKTFVDPQLTFARCSWPLLPLNFHAPWKQTKTNASVWRAGGLSWLCCWPGFWSGGDEHWQTNGTCSSPASAAHKRRIWSERPNSPLGLRPPMGVVKGWGNGGDWGVVMESCSLSDKTVLYACQAITQLA